MADSIMYQEDAFVILETNKPEEFLTPQELLTKLKLIVESQPDDGLPQELAKFSSSQEKAQYLMDNFCELNLAPGEYLQWYVVRLEK